VKDLKQDRVIVKETFTTEDLDKRREKLMEIILTLIKRKERI